jgi:hypothetical protein
VIARSSRTTTTSTKTKNKREVLSFSLPHYGMRKFFLPDLFKSILEGCSSIYVFRKLDDDPVLSELCTHLKPRAWISTEVFSSFISSIYDCMTSVERDEAGILPFFRDGNEVFVFTARGWDHGPAKYTKKGETDMRNKKAILMPIHHPNHWTACIVCRLERKIILFDGLSKAPRYLVSERRTLRDCFNSICSVGKRSIGENRTADHTRDAFMRLQVPSNSFFRMIYQLKLQFDGNTGVINLKDELPIGVVSELDYVICAYDSPVQTDGYNCGPLALCFFEAYLRGKIEELVSASSALISREHMDMYRYYIMSVCVKRLKSSTNLYRVAM